MKNLKKFAAVLSAAAVMTMSVSAFAASGVEYDKDAELVALTNKDSIATADEQYTVVIIPATAAAQTSDLSDETIMYINQGTNEEPFWTFTKDDEGNITDGGMGVKAGTLQNGDYILRIGAKSIADSAEEGEDKYIELEFSVSEGREIQLGDCDGIAGIDIGDGNAIVKEILSPGTLTGDALIAADCDGITGIDIGDGNAVVKEILNPGTLGKVTVK